MDNVNTWQITAFALFVLGVTALGEALTPRKHRLSFLLAGIAGVSFSITIFYMVVKLHPELFAGP